MNIQGVELRFSSGNKSNDITIATAQNIDINYQHNRQEVTYLGNYCSETNKPIINYTPIQLSFGFIKNDNNLIEENIGLFNPSGCCINLVESNNQNNYSSRDFKLIARSPNSQNYSNQINLYSGYLTSYSLTAGLGTPIVNSISFECLDMESISNISGQQNISDSIIISPENFHITGMNFSGFGVSGLQIQNFGMNLTIQRSNVFKIGQKFPEKSIVNTSAQIQLNGFINNLSTINRLSTINNNIPYSGNLNIGIKRTCSETDILDILIQKPYVDSVSISNRVGDLANFSISMSVKPTIRPSESGLSNIIFY